MEVNNIRGGGFSLFNNIRVQCDDGSTGTYMIARPTQTGRYLLQVGNVGDSRIIVGKAGTAYPMTTDHKPSTDSERMRIEAAGGHVANDRVDGRLAVSRAYGDKEYKSGGHNELTHKVIASPDVTHVECGKEDFVFLSCDGVYERNFSNEEVITFVQTKLSQTNDLAAVASMVCDEAVARGSKDNISAMILQFADGTDYQNLTEKVETLPGPFHRRSEEFQKAYVAQLGGLALNEAVLRRYDHAVAELEKRIRATKTDLTAKTCDISTLDDYELRDLVGKANSIDHLLRHPRSLLESAAREVFNHILICLFFCKH